MTSSLLLPTSTSTGAAEPRVRSVPPYERTLGREAVDFMGQVGRPLDDWQAAVVVDAFGLRPDGYWSAFELAVLVARQNGKGAITEAIELAGLFLFGDQLVMHSAHLFKTAKNAFQRLVNIIDGSDWLTRRVHQVVRARGDEAIILTAKAGGGQLLCFSRSAGSGRGFTGDRTVFDEAQYLTVEQYAAATPTLATVPNPQIIYTGTPPDEDVGPMPENAMLPSVRKRGHKGFDRVALYEWSPPKRFDRTDPAVWRANNPALGIRITEWFLAKQLENFTEAGKPEKFDTEHLGAWPEDTQAKWQVIPEVDYLGCCDDSSGAADPLVFAIDTTPERSFSSIAAMGLRANLPSQRLGDGPCAGDLHGEVVDHGAGTSWVVARAVELHRKWSPARWVVDAGGAAGFLVPLLIAEGVPVDALSTRNVAQAYGMFRTATATAERRSAPESAEELTGTPSLSEEDAVVVPRLWIRPGRHGPSLASAVEGATTRRIGDGTTWDRKVNTVVISPLVALTNALFGFCTREVEEVLPPPATAPAAPEDRSSFFRPAGRLNL